MKRILYALIFFPPVNRLLRNLTRILVRVFPRMYRIPPSGRISVAVNGHRMIMRTNPSSYLTQVVYWQGCNGFEYSALFRELIGNIQGFYDVGANLGYYTLLAGLTNRNVRVVAFEPADGPFNYLVGHVRTNGITDRVRCEKLALSERTGDITFYEYRNPQAWHTGHNLSGAGSVIPIENAFPYRVPTMTVDDYAKNHPHDVIDLIKMDTEGNEPAILDGAHSTLQRLKPIVICEMLFGQNEAKLEAIFRNHGYLFYLHSEGGLHRAETLMRERDDGVRNVFFVHPARQHLIQQILRLSSDGS